MALLPIKGDVWKPYTCKRGDLGDEVIDSKHFFIYSSIEMHQAGIVIGVELYNTRARNLHFCTAALVHGNRAMACRCSKAV